LIHSEGPAHQDMSLPILRDVMRLRRNWDQIA
jgi:hypothetical protein